jgi:hypothetical protein
MIALKSYNDCSSLIHIDHSIVQPFSSATSSLLKKGHIFGTFNTILQPLKNIVSSAQAPATFVSSENHHFSKKQISISATFDYVFLTMFL